MFSMAAVTFDPVPATIATVSLVGLWSVAGLHKLADVEAFERSVEAYEVAPRVMVPVIGRLLPILELAIGMGLVFSETRGTAGALSALLLMIYGGVIALNLRRGRRALDCGCMTLGSQSRISAMLVWRNAIAAIASLAVGLLPRTERTTNWLDSWTIVAGVAMIALLYIVMDALRAAALRLAPPE